MLRRERMLLMAVSQIVQPNTNIQRCAAEFIGTFVIVFAPVALSATKRYAGADGSLLSAALVSGLAVLTMIYAFGHISSAHFNPAVTLGFAVVRRFPWKMVPWYWVSQVLGGIAAAGLVGMFFGFGHGTHVPVPGPALRDIAFEAILTFLLMTVVISVATDTRVPNSVPGLAIGMTVVLDVLIGGPVTGGSMNPARSLGPALFAGHAAQSAYWIYVVGPAIGAVSAALLYEAVRGNERKVSAGQNDMLDALQDISGRATG